MMNLKRGLAMRFLALWLCLIGSVAHAQIAIDNTASNSAMADEMFGEGFTVNSTTIIGQSTQSGIFTDGDVGGAGYAPTDTGLVFMTAPTGFFDDGDSTNSHIDFTASGVRFTGNGNVGAGPGDADINALDPDNYFDAAGIIINFTANRSGTVDLPVQYMTEEYPQYYQQGFSDIGAVFLDVDDGNINYVLQPATGAPNGYFEVDTLPGPPPGVTPPIYNGDTGTTLSVQTDFNAGALGNVPITVSAGVTYNVKIVIADQFDSGFDSGFLIAGEGFTLPPPVVIANDDDTITNVETSTDQTGVINVLDNDSIGPDVPTPSTVDIAVASGSSVPAGLTFNPDGTIDVAANTPSGTYEFDYTICEIDNGVVTSNCSTATASVGVDGPIVANDDSVAGIDGVTGATGVVDVFANNGNGTDTLNGSDISVGDVVLTVAAPATPIDGGPVPVLNTATGLVDVPAGTPSGAYTISYQICEPGFPTNCSTASIEVIVAPIPLETADDMPPAVIGSIGDPSVINAFDNDRVDEAPVDPNDVIATILTPATPASAGQPVPEMNTSTGVVSVPPQTPEGTYAIEYQLCLQSDPATCETAEITVVVEAQDIDAGDDTPPSVNGLTGNPSLLNAFDNDTLGGNPVDTDDITATIKTPAFPLFAGAPVPEMDPATGVVSVPPNTPAGTYTISYEICEDLNPTNCSTASVTVEVDPAPLAAVTDTPPAVNGLIGDPSLVNAFDNDTLNGTPVDPDDITGTITSAATPLSPGAPVPEMNPNTGVVSVPPNTPAGTYTIAYEICEDLNPTNCSDTSVTIEVDAAPVVANNDTPAAVNGLTGNPDAGDALANDLLNGTPVDPNDVTTSVTTPATPASPGAPVPFLQTAGAGEGTITVPPNTPAGTYTIAYQFCEDLNPTNCDTASITVEVDPAPLEAEDDLVSGVNGFSGSDNVLSVFADNGNGPDTLNGVAVVPAAVTLSTITPASSLGGNVPVLQADGTVDVPAGTTAGAYTIEYQLCENLNPTNCDTATITVNVDPPSISAADDTITGVDGFAGETGVINVLDTNGNGPDLLDGAAVEPADVTVSQTVAATPASPGAPVPVVNADGSVDVPPGTPAGSYTMTYQICETLNPANCDTASVTVGVDEPAIDARVEATPTIDGSSPPAGAFMNVLTSDVIGGVPATPTNVDITLVSIETDTGAPYPNITMDPATGDVTMTGAAGGAVVEITYQICDAANPTNCSTITENVAVTPLDLEALPGAFPPINGTDGGSTVSVIDTDLVDSTPADFGRIEIPDPVPGDYTDLATGDPVTGLTLDPLTGIVTVAPGTPAGTYGVYYEICTLLAPVSCDGVTETITVEPAPLVGTDDMPPSVNGLTGDPTLVNVFDNDTLNGDPVDPNEISASVQTPATPVSPGAPVPTLDPATGIVSVPPNTPAGPYSIVYELCEDLNPTNCETATVTVEVDPAPLVAGDDTPPSVNGLIGNPSLVNAFDNDTLNGSSVDPDDITATVSSPASPLAPGAPVPALDPATGVVSVPAGTPAGSYTIEYEICEDLNPSNCETASVTVEVDPAPIVANNVTPPETNGLTGDPAVVNVLDTDTLNGDPIDPNDVTVTVSTPATPMSPGAPVPELDPSSGVVSVPPNTPSGVYTITYEVCEDLNPTNCGTATVSVEVVEAPMSAMNDNPPAVNGLTGDPALVNVLDNDTINGSPVDPDNVTTSVSSPAVPEIPGNPVPMLETSGPNEGVVTVPPGTPPGTYIIGYQICEDLNPANCADATVRVVVDPAPIVAMDDTLTDPFDGSFPTTNILDVLGNDTLNGVDIIRPDVVVTPVGPLPAGFVLNPDGTVDTTAPIISGDYSFEYQVCEVDSTGAATSNCETASVTVPVVSSVPSIAGTVFDDADGDGELDPGENRLGGYTVELRDSTGTLIATTVTDPATGEYQIGGFPPGSGYEIVFREPETNLAIGGLSDLTFGPKSILTDMNQPIDPAGVMYDSITGDPISGVTLQLQTASGAPLPAACLLPGQQNQTTGSNGKYAFDLIPGADPACPVAPTEYRLAVLSYPSGYTPGDSVIQGPQAGVLDATTCNGLDAIPGGACQLSALSTAPDPLAIPPYFLAFSIGAGDPEILNNHIPVDPVSTIPASGFRVTKVADVSSARVGQTIFYTIEAFNDQPIAAGPLIIRDTLPAGLLYAPGSGAVDGVPLEPTQTGNVFVFPDVTVPGNGSSLITIAARVSPLVEPGIVTNRATPIDPTTGAALSASGTADVRIVAEHVFDCTDIIGKVFDDLNQNGYQNEGEPGLAGVRLATVQGTLITTDKYGRYNVPCAELPKAEGSNFTLKLDTRTLPTGYRVTTENPRTIRATAGKLAKLNFGASISRVIDIDLSGAAFEASTNELSDRLVEGISGLVGQMKDKPSVIRVSYFTDGEDKKTIRARLNKIEQELRQQWKQRGRYKLVIERTIKSSR